MNELALYAGLGGPLASILCGWRAVCYVERDAWCVGRLIDRIEEGHIPAAPIWDDARTFDGRPLRGAVEIISAGFPCQPFSCAGRRRGAKDRRNLWPATLRILRQVQPPLAFLENVPGLMSHAYFKAILADLAESGFDAEWDVFSAAASGAPHIRKRLWILAHAKGLQWEELIGGSPDGVLPEDVADSIGERGVAAPEGRPLEKRTDGLETVVRHTFPTPCVSDATGGRTTKGRKRRGEGGLRRGVRDAMNGGPLNPQFLEWLMGWPIGWTGCEPVGTDGFRRWLRAHGGC